MGHSWDWVEGLKDCSLILVNKHSASDLRMRWQNTVICSKLFHPRLNLINGVCSVEPGAHNPVCATAILGLCNGIFTDQFIFSTIWQHFFLRKWKHCPV